MLETLLFVRADLKDTESQINKGKSCFLFNAKDDLSDFSFFLLFELVERKQFHCKDSVLHFLFFFFLS